MSVSLQNLIEQGLIRVPSKLYGELGGFQFEATVNADGSLTAGGREFNSLSVAAGCLIQLKPEGCLPSAHTLLVTGGSSGMCVMQTGTCIP